MNIYSHIIIFISETRKSEYSYLNYVLIICSYANKMQKSLITYDHDNFPLLLFPNNQCLLLCVYVVENIFSSVQYYLNGANVWWLKIRRVYL